MRERCVMMIQQGARRNYIYARQLEEAGLLHSLVTDAAWAEGVGGVVATLTPRLAPRLKGVIARRTVRGVAPERVRASFLPNLVGIARPALHEETVYTIADEALGARCRLRGIIGAGIVVNYHGNGGTFLDAAKASGAKIVTDFVVTPKYLEIEQEERVRWPGWEVRSTPAGVMAAYKRKMSRLVTISDVYLCPSESVARDLAELPGFDPARVRLVPYGHSSVLLRAPNPAPGRVLFAGAAGLRKGLPYLAEAAAILKPRRPDIEIVVAGQVTDLVRNRPEAHALTFLGALDREAMADEFARADLYCLPSLAEGSATSVFEAMANGLPIVTTRSSGSVVRDGVEGLLVAERDGLAVAQAIERIVIDRSLRERLSEAAKASSITYSDEACGRRFVTVIKAIAAGCASPGA